MYTPISIIICTRNRAESLKGTLDSLNSTYIPYKYKAELIVVDNGSTDGTANVVRAANLKNFIVNYLNEGRKGQSNARNTGIAHSSGQIIIFIDDDVHVSSNWLEQICTPIMLGKADAVAGGVSIAPTLRRNWMTPIHEKWLASTEYIDCANPREMIGANMGF